LARINAVRKTRRGMHEDANWEGYVFRGYRKLVQTQTDDFQEGKRTELDIPYNKENKRARAEEIGEKVLFRKGHESTRSTRIVEGGTFSDTRII